jgi:hypothetical protein
MIFVLNFQCLLDIGLVRRESDYAILTREFEDLVDDKILEAVRAATEAAATTVTASTACEGESQTVEV